MDYFAPRVMTSRSWIWTPAEGTEQGGLVEPTDALRRLCVGNREVEHAVVFYPEERVRLLQCIRQR